jgi:hypothetical protein
MNIRRGLFRLWIVVSVAGVLGSGIIWYRMNCSSLLNAEE